MPKVQLLIQLVSPCTYNVYTYTVYLYKESAGQLKVWNINEHAIIPT